MNKTTTARRPGDRIADAITATNCVLIAGVLREATPRNSGLIQEITEVDQPETAAALRILVGAGYAREADEQYAGTDWYVLTEAGQLLQDFLEAAPMAAAYSWRLDALSQIVLTVFKRFGQKAVDQLAALMDGTHDDQ